MVRGHAVLRPECGYIAGARHDGNVMKRQRAAATVDSC